MCGDLLFDKRQPDVGLLNAVDLRVADLEEAVIGICLGGCDIKLVIALVVFDVIIPVVVCPGQTLHGDHMCLFPSGQGKSTVFIGEHDVLTVADAHACDGLACCFVVYMSVIHGMFSCVVLKKL